jgi:preprotein translocase subunit SecY
VFKGNRMMRQSGESHIPLRVNSAGMIPLIFAQSIIIFPSTIAAFFTAATGTVGDIARGVTSILNPNTFPYQVLYFLMVVGFTYFYTTVVFSQQNIAENLQKSGGVVPGKRPGPATQKYLTSVLNRITFLGAVFLGVVAVLPYFGGIVTNVQFLYSSTALLIVVGVAIDTMKQLEAQLLMRNYEGFIKR